MEDRKDPPELEVPEGYCLGPVLSGRAPQDERDVPMGIMRKVEGRSDNAPSRKPSSALCLRSS